MFNKFRRFAFLVALFSALFGCNGLETDISKKLDFSFDIFSSDTTFANLIVAVYIPNHDEIDDYVDYAVYPNPFLINEVSYKVGAVQPGNHAGLVDLSVFYRNTALDTIPLFQVNDLPVIPGNSLVASVSQVDLGMLSDLVNAQNYFDLIIEANSADTGIDFTVEIYFDTTIAVDYDEI